MFVVHGSWLSQPVMLSAQLVEVRQAELGDF
jgi:hypothetical protein